MFDLCTCLIALFSFPSPFSPDWQYHVLLTRVRRDMVWGRRKWYTRLRSRHLPSNLLAFTHVFDVYACSSASEYLYLSIYLTTMLSMYLLFVCGVLVWLPRRCMCKSQTPLRLLPSFPFPFLLLFIFISCLHYCYIGFIRLVLAVLWVIIADVQHYVRRMLHYHGMAGENGWIVECPSTPATHILPPVVS
uniref:Uncharacterized protein TCIL3000_2_270 n=1 Tax=Trypanosoma congolense (strain IL3000) TaxID=1068625 RepID=G0UJA7_TRYCI|nr:unnamed protein product [Trypanosoma congolense IL3000]